MERLTRLRLTKARKILRTTPKYVLTGQTQKLISPMTGKLTLYYETYNIQVAEPATAPDLDGLRDRINNDLISQSVDGFCENILYMGGVFQDQYKTKTWIAGEQPQLEARLGRERLVAPIIIAAILLAIAIIVAAIAIVIVVYVLASSFTTISQWILQPPQYVGGTPDNPEVYDTWAEYLSAQHLRYWYVCPKCGAGFGDKTKYPNIEDVPEAEVNAYNEHMEVCQGIPTGVQNILVWLIFAGAAIVAVIVVVPTVAKAISGVAKEIPK